jgi:hypothetical protein
VGEGLIVGIFMYDMKDHILFTWDQQRHWSRFYATGDSYLGKYWRFSKPQLLGSTHPTAMGVTNFFWQRFGWFDAPLEKLISDQTFD